MSKDMCDNKMQSIWRLSQMTLEHNLYGCKCMITHQNTNNPKLIVLGGCNGNDNDYTKTHLEFNLSDVIGWDTFIRFYLCFIKVR